ncbi:MAG TPA: dephospho-CoA kinase [Sandaracinaceae bacterium LLY-WYZ-13_1]|nr:dephospho-CoA kinase [Sandaracinaceae bacterium LLY-WYZ-13_1]
MAFGIVGLTGGIGSGKSTVARVFTEQGVPVVDADRVARDVVAPGSDGLTDVVEAFGREVLDADGALDRAKLADRVFDDEEARRRLEGILHPRIAARSMARLSELATEGHAYAIYEAALLVESGSHRMMQALVVVSARRETQVARVRARDGLDDAQIERRLHAQLPLEEKVAVADYVIDNDGTLEQTRAQVLEVHRALLARFGGES